LQRETFPDGVELDYHWRLVPYKELFNYGISTKHELLGVMRPLAYPTKE
jgi:hypothetical protein